MSDIYIPGVRSRFDNEKLIEDLMKLERIPKERAQSNIERYETERTYWQELNSRAVSLRDSARLLYSYQNPFNERTVRSSDETVLSAAATREASEQTTSFTVKQIAQADRFLSKPLDENFQIESGTYTFSVGENEISFEFKGGSLKEFTDTFNRRGRDVFQSSLVTVRPGTRSLLIESKVTGEENRLSFSGAAIALGESTGMIELVYGNEQTQMETKPLNAVSLAQDTIIAMEGIEVYRPNNEISDLIPGVTINAKEVSTKPVRLSIETDNEAVKEAIITMVGNYNRLMAEINVLTRSDEKVISELSYLSNDEKAEYRKRLGVFSGDSTLQQMRTTLLRIVSSPYPTSLERDLSFLTQIGIGSDIRRSGGTDPSQLRGYLDIDEKILDSAIGTKLTAIKELFGSDTTGDLLVNSGVAYNLETLTRPYVELGGLFALKTNSMSSRIDQEKTRIVTMDRQLEIKEAELKKQYSQMEGAYTRMEQMTSSFGRFQQQNSNQ